MAVVGGEGRAPEGDVGVPRDQHVLVLILEPVQVEVVQAPGTEEAVGLGHEVLHGDITDEAGEIEQALNRRGQPILARLVHQAHQVLDGAVDRLVALGLVDLRIEADLVRLEVVAQVLEVPLVFPVELEEVAVVLGVAVDGAEDPLQQVLVHRFDDDVEAGVLVVHVQPRVRLAGGRDLEAGIERHRHGLVDARRVLGEVVEDDRLQAEELLVGGVPVEVHAEPGLGAAPGPGPAGPDAGVPHGQAVPDEVGGVVVVLPEVLLQLGPVGRVHEEIHPLEDLPVEQVVSGRRGRNWGLGRRRGRREAQGDRHQPEKNPCGGTPHRANYMSTSSYRPPVPRPRAFIPRECSPAPPEARADVASWVCPGINVVRWVTDCTVGSHTGLDPRDRDGDGERRAEQWRPDRSSRRTACNASAPRHELGLGERHCGHGLVWLGGHGPGRPPAGQPQR